MSVHVFITGKNTAASSRSVMDDACGTARSTAGTAPGAMQLLKGRAVVVVTTVVAATVVVVVVRRGAVLQGLQAAGQLVAQLGGGHLRAGLGC